MFIHQSQLEHLLRPEDYYDEAVFQRERERLFLSTWHFLISAAELPRHGDFRTLEMFDQPILVRNQNGEIHAYLNVCPHRHCMLTSERTGHSEAFRCQYHGWEFNADGRTGKIPDARCFRPFDRENACLHKFRTERWGDMVFITFGNAGSLEEQLGEFYHQASTWFAPPFRWRWTWETEYDANWKIVTENSLESYHIPCLHKKSFGVAPPEETCQHVLNERYTTFHTPEPVNAAQWCQNFLVRSLGMTPRNVYTHHHVHPNLIFISMDVMRMAQLMEPISPTRTRHRVWVYTLDGVRRNPWAWMMRQALSRLTVYVANQVLQEDSHIFARVQRGMHASRFRGVIGTREERLYAFQQYVRNAIDSDGGMRTPLTVNRRAE